MRANPPWTAFWWTNDGYAIARNLDLTVSASALPEGLFASVVTWLDRQDPSGTPFDLAQWLTCALHSRSPSASFWADRLLAAQQRDGSWPSSRCLRVPAQRGARARIVETSGGTHFTTAAAVLAVKSALAAAT
jgi:hypothetical protein